MRATEQEALGKYSIAYMPAAVYLYSGAKYPNCFLNSEKLEVHFAEYFDGGSYVKKLNGEIESKQNKIKQILKRKICKPSKGTCATQTYK